MTFLARQVAELLLDLGINAGDVVFVHSGASAIAALSPHASGPDERVNALHQGLNGVLGAEGTIASPSYYYDYARHGHPFELEKSEPDAALGRYPRFLFGQPGLCRSLNPITSIQALGAKAETICAHTSAYGYGTTSPWARLVELDAWCLFIGASFQSMTFVHHVEAMVGVPHLYNKIHHPPILSGGRQVDLPAMTAVRYLNYGISYNLERLEEALAQQGALRTRRDWGGNAQCVRFRTVESVLTTALTRDPYFLLNAPPTFVRGQPPDDGATGPAPSPIAPR